MVTPGHDRGQWSPLFSRGPGEAGRSRLLPRLAKIARLVIAGHPDRAIAEPLGLTSARPLPPAPPAADTSAPTPAVLPNGDAAANEPARVRTRLTTRRRGLEQCEAPLHRHAACPTSIPIEKRSPRRFSLRAALAECKTHPTARLTIEYSPNQPVKVNGARPLGHVGRCVEDVLKAHPPRRAMTLTP